MRHFLLSALCLAVGMVVFSQAASMYKKEGKKQLTSQKKSPTNSQKRSTPHRRFTSKDSRKSLFQRLRTLLFFVLVNGQTGTFVCAFRKKEYKTTTMAYEQPEEYEEYETTKAYK